MNQQTSKDKEPKLKRPLQQSKENTMDLDASDSEVEDPSQTQAFTQELRNKYSKMISVTESIPLYIYLIFV